MRYLSKLVVLWSVAVLAVTMDQKHSTHQLKPSVSAAAGVTMCNKQNC